MSYLKPEVLIYQYSPTSRSGGSPPAIYESAATPTPIADFSGSPRTGLAPLTVAYIDLSTYEPTSWAWDFQNNGSVDSTYRYPTVTYNTAGSYDVKLTISNEFGSSTIIKNGYIVVTNPPPPVADFSGSPLTGVAPLTVNFSDLSTNTPTSWAWDFQNNGSVDSTVQNPTFIYTTAGTYAVKLTSTNAYGSSIMTKSAYVVVTTPAPTTLDINFNTIGPSGASSSTADYDAGNPAGSLWTSLGVTFSTGLNIFPTINAYDDPYPTAYEGAGFLRTRVDDTTITIGAGFNFTSFSFYLQTYNSTSMRVYYRNGVNINLNFGSGGSWGSNTISSLITHGISGYIIDRIEVHSGNPFGNTNLDSFHFA